MNKLILLHGALGHAAQFNELKKRLPESLDVHCLEFYGHGNTDFGADFTIKSLTNQVFNYMNDQQIAKASFFGHSMGGYVALNTASDYPERVSRIFTLGTMLKWNEDILQKEVRMMDADKLEEKLPAFAAYLDRTHIHGWRNLLEATKSLLNDLVTRQYLDEKTLSKISCPVRLGIGDRDISAGVANTLYCYTLLKQGQLEVFPNTPHPYERINMDKLVASLVSFCG